MTDTIIVPGGEPEPPATSAETTDLAVQVGETNVKVEQAVENSGAAVVAAGQAAEAATVAAAAAVEANTPPPAPDTSQFVTREELASLLAPPVPEPTPEPAPEPEPDSTPKSREKRVKKKSLADRFYGR